MDDFAKLTQTRKSLIRRSDPERTLPQCDPFIPSNFASALCLRGSTWPRHHRSWRRRCLRHLLIQPFCLMCSSGEKLVLLSNQHLGIERLFSYGPMLIGVFMNMILYGVCLQAFWYQHNWQNLVWPGVCSPGTEFSFACALFVVSLGLW